jgi:hypothetical protein
MRPFAILFCVAALPACSHPQNPERRDPLTDQVTGELRPTDPLFLKGDPAASVACRGDAQCPTGALCHPAKNVCFTPKMQVAKLGFSCPLVPVYFQEGSSKLVPEARSWIDYDARCLRARGADSVSVDGFSDTRGSDQQNVELSRRRAEVVKTALEEHGATAGILIEVRGYGATELIGGHNEHDYAYDRRVELNELR